MVVVALLLLNLSVLHVIVSENFNQFSWNVDGDVVPKQKNDPEGPSLGK